MDAIRLLKEDHRTVMRLFRDFEGREGSVRKGEIGTHILDELEVHSQVEEEIFYPAVDARGDERQREMVKEAIEEHRIVKDLVSELRGRSPEDDTYDAQFKVLRENVEHHVQEEENEMFEHVRSTMDDELADLGARMQQRKAELKKSASGSMTGALRGFVAKAFEAVAGTPSTPRRRAAKPKARAVKAKARRAASTVSKTRTKVKRRATKMASTASKRRPAKKATSSARKRGRSATTSRKRGTATSRSVAQAKRSRPRTRTARRRSAGGKR
jgi:hemerythrin-like domain-containing protein